mmetsp:Transcript_104204/g.334316  ORF Transcript_104204/g.334316 Transcript_104204/m.334316 type:complete len:205 (-) Transcript_104204:68-682(-)
MVTDVFQLDIALEERAAGCDVPIATCLIGIFAADACNAISEHSGKGRPIQHVTSSTTKTTAVNNLSAEVAILVPLATADDPQRKRLSRGAAAGQVRLQRWDVHVMVLAEHDQPLGPPVVARLQHLLLLAGHPSVVVPALSRGENAISHLEGVVALARDGKEAAFPYRHGSPGVQLCFQFRLILLGIGRHHPIEHEGCALNLAQR